MFIVDTSMTHDFGVQYAHPRQTEGTLTEWREGILLNRLAAIFLL